MKPVCNAFHHRLQSQSFSRKKSFTQSHSVAHAFTLFSCSPDHITRVYILHLHDTKKQKEIVRTPSPTIRRNVSTKHQKSFKERKVTKSTICIRHPSHARSKQNIRPTKCIRHTTGTRVKLLYYRQRESSFTLQFSTGTCLPISIEINKFGNHFQSMTEKNYHCCIFRNSVSTG